MENVKTFNVRISKDLWAFVKKSAVDNDVSMNHVVTKCLEKYRKHVEKSVDEF